VIAVRAGRDHVRPFVDAAQMPWDDMVDRHAAFALPAILTGIIITAEDLPAR
jgi:hypothetical protein